MSKLKTSPNLELTTLSDEALRSVLCRLTDDLATVRQELNARAGYSAPRYVPEITFTEKEMSIITDKLQFIRTVYQRLRSEPAFAVHPLLEMIANARSKIVAD